MITDSQTNFVYLADTLPQKQEVLFTELVAIFKKANIDYSFLHGTNDIWAVDYMPIQLSHNRFVNFKYAPSYLSSKSGMQSITCVSDVCERIKLQFFDSCLKVEGGNVIKSKSIAILCDRVFMENPHLSTNDVIEQLYKTLEVDKVVFIPTHNHDYLGHADGVVRFYDSDTVIINKYSKIDAKYETSLKLSLHNAGLKFIEIPYNPYQNRSYSDATGVYTNYLEVDDLIVLPVFKQKEDEEVVRLFESLFPKRNIYTLYSKELASNDGIINCITWNIKL